MTSSIGAVWRSRSVLGLLVRRDLTVKYQQSLLGYLWSLIEPLTTAAIYWFVFGVLYNTSIEVAGQTYILYLVSGIFAWIWATSVMGEATGALTSQSRLITTIRVPREVFPIGRVTGKLIEFVAALPVLLGFAVVFNGRFTWYLLLIPVAMLLQAALLVGLALLLASLNVLLRDVEKITRLAQRAIFYALPIIYPLSRLTDSERVPEWIKIVYQVNPFVGIFELYHAAWMPELFPSALPLWSAVAGSLILLAGGWLVFRRAEPAVLKEL